MRIWAVHYDVRTGRSYTFDGWAYTSRVERFMSERDAGDFVVRLARRDDIKRVRLEPEEVHQNLPDSLGLPELEAADG